MSQPIIIPDVIMSNILRRIAKVEAALEQEHDDPRTVILFLAESEDGEDFDRFARRTYGFGRYIVVRFIESDRAIADLHPIALAFRPGGEVFR